MASPQYTSEPTTGRIPIYGPDSAVTKWLTPRDASYRRVLSQDTAYIYNWTTQYGILNDMRSAMLVQLEQHCGVEPGLQILSLQEGCQLVHRYTGVGYDEQLRWLLMDLSAREAIYTLDLARTAPGMAAASNFYGQAVSLRMDFNSQQIDHLKQMLSAQRPEKIAEIRDAIQASSRTAQTPMPRPQRIPLAESSRNIMSNSSTPLTKTAERKKEGSNSTDHALVLPLDGGSDDENVLQGKADALQARIAAIRARTSHDDDLMPRKKAKTARKATTLQPPVTPAMRLTPPTNSDDTNRATHLALSSTKAHMPREPRPQSREQTEDGLVIRTSTVTRGNGQKIKVSLVTMKTKPDLPAQQAASVKLILKRHGQIDYWLRVPQGLDLARVATIAKKQFSIDSQQSVCLHFEGQRLSTAETVEEADLQDYAVLKMFDLPPKRASPVIPGATVLGKLRNKLTGFEADLSKVNSTPAQSVLGSSLLSEPYQAQAIVDLTSSSPPHHEATSAPAPLTAPAPSVQVEPVLCREQQEVVDLIAAGHNVFYTGSAGCGKSTVLKAFTALLRDNGKIVRIVAPTGKAALDINGSTTWTYAGWTPGHMKKPLEELIKAAHGKYVSTRFRRTDVLVIDEVSMVESHLLERLDRIMQAARGNYKPFGGVQLVVTGDFCQLPPVKAFQFCMFCGREQRQVIGPNRETLYRCPQHGDCNDEDKWAFKSKVWERCGFKHINLTNIHRQSDQVFIGILQKLRIGKPLTNADRQLLLDHPCDVKNAVKLFPMREEVRRINQTEFDRLVTAKREYRCLDYFSWNEVHGNLRDKGRRSPVDNSLEALREHRLETKVEFKAGMLVVLLVNLDIANGLVNGSQGRVIGFEPYVESKLPKAAVFEGGGFSSSSSGGGRKKSRRGREASPSPSQAMVQGELRGEYAVLREGQIKSFIEQPFNQEKRWPIVEFDNKVRRAIYADCQVNELGDEKPYTLLARTQIPLLAAWAMTIHKSQGMTLNRVIVDLGRSFEEGQEYVALSRARSLDGLKVMSLGSNVGTGGNEQVKKFLKEKFNIG